MRHRLCDHITAARAGRHDGRLGLSVEEAADGPFLVRLRHRTRARQAAVSERLAEDLLALERDAVRAEDLARSLRARRTVLVERAGAATRAHAAAYECLCARYGRAWQRCHRDRRIAHVGWRCPRLNPPATEARS